MSLTPGQRLGRYEIRSKIGEGGMGVVYCAYDCGLDRQVAVKILPADRARDPVRRRRFLREAKAASALNHPNIVTIYEVGNEKGIDFLAMELIDGQTLTDKLKSGPIRLDVAIEYAAQVTEALDCAHSAGLVHRDLKPGNIMITGAGRVKLLDFGLAKHNSKAMELSNTSPLTEEGAVLGTLAYMSPEQARGEETGPESDIFSFGILFFEMLVGERPFTGSSQVELFHNILYSDPAPIIRNGKQLPDKLTNLGLKMLAKQPHDRMKAGSAASILREIIFQLHSKAGRGLGFIGSRRTTVTGRVLTMALALACTAAAGVWLIPRAQQLIHRFGVPEATQSNPSDSWGFVNRGRVYFHQRYRKGNLDKAAADFEAAIRMDEQNAAAYAGLADTQVAMYLESPDKQLLESAKRSAQTALRLNDKLAASQASWG